MKKITAWIMVLCIVIVTVLLPPGKTEAYIITEKGGMRTASELSEVVFIEEHNNEAVMIATTSDENRVIPTVRSRMTVKRINLGMSHDDFEKYCFSKCIGESNLYFALTSGNIGKIDSVGS